MDVSRGSVFVSESGCPGRIGDSAVGAPPEKTLEWCRTRPCWVATNNRLVTGVGNSPQPTYKQPVGRIPHRSDRTAKMMMPAADHSVRSILRWFNPIAWMLDLRRSLTPASVMLILIGIISLNIVWGYPWLGMLAACLAMFMVGRIVNSLSVPKLRAFANVPNHVPVGEELAAPIRLTNVGRWPGMDLSFERSYSCRFLAPESETSVLQTVRFRRRGQRRLPPILVESYFPFHLFRSQRFVDSATTVTATPPRLFAESDKQWRTLEATLKGIASRSSQGDQIHYIGNQEYREGVPVRRWDFASWARLGKPVLREYSSPSSKTVSIVVDNLRPKVTQHQSRTTSRWWRQPHETIDEPFERILSLAASSVETLSRSGAAVILRFAHGDISESTRRKYRCEAGADPGELLIALGNAKTYTLGPSDEADWPLHEEGQNGTESEAVIVLTCRPNEDRRRPPQTSYPSPTILWVGVDSIQNTSTESASINSLPNPRRQFDRKEVVI